MLDTDLCIRLLRDRPAHLRARFNAEADGLAISTTVLMELLHGAAKSRRPADTRRSVEDFSARLSVLPSMPAPLSMRRTSKRIGKARAG